GRHLPPRVAPRTARPRRDRDREAHARVREDLRRRDDLALTGLRILLGVLERVVVEHDRETERRDAVGRLVALRTEHQGEPHLRPGLLQSRHLRQFRGRGHVEPADEFTVDQLDDRLLRRLDLAVELLLVGRSRGLLLRELLALALELGLRVRGVLEDVAELPDLRDAPAALPLERQLEAGARAHGHVLDGLPERPDDHSLTPEKGVVAGYD